MWHCYFCCLPIVLSFLSGFSILFLVCLFFLLIFWGIFCSCLFWCSLVSVFHHLVSLTMSSASPRPPVPDLYSAQVSPPLLVFTHHQCIVGFLPQFSLPPYDSCCYPSDPSCLFVCLFVFVVLGRDCHHVVFFKIVKLFSLVRFKTLFLKFVQRAVYIR